MAGYVITIDEAQPKVGALRLKERYLPTEHYRLGGSLGRGGLISSDHGVCFGRAAFTGLETGGGFLEQKQC